MTTTSRTHLVLMKGFPASGKSSLAAELSRRLLWPIIDKDDIKDYTLNLENGNSLAYDIMWSIARRQLSLAHSIIVDSPLTYPEAFADGRDLAHQYGAELLVIETRLDERVWRERLAQRDPLQSAHKIASWTDMQRLLRRYDGCWQYEIPSDVHLVVDGTEPIEHSVEAALKRMRIDEIGASTGDD